VAVTNRKVVAPFATGEMGGARHSCPNGYITMRCLTVGGTFGSHKALKYKGNI
jgi:hypothetical protein